MSRRTMRKSVMTSAFRKANGSTILELPIGLWVCLILFFMPMLALATITFRNTMFNIMVQDMAHAAAKGSTFATTTADGPSCKDLADSSLAAHLKALPGIVPGATTIAIVTTPINGSSSVRTTSSLSLPADSSKNVYQIEVQLSAKLDPLFALNSDIFPQVPGLTSPMNITCASREMAENPQGLNR